MGRYDRSDDEFAKRRKLAKLKTQDPTGAAIEELEQGLRKVEQASEAQEAQRAGKVFMRCAHCRREDWKDAQDRQIAYCPDCDRANMQRALPPQEAFATGAIPPGATHKCDRCGKYGTEPSDWHERTPYWPRCSWQCNGEMGLIV